MWKSEAEDEKSEPEDEESWGIFFARLTPVLRCWALTLRFFSCHPDESLVEKIWI